MIRYEAAAEAAAVDRPKPGRKELVGLLTSWLVAVLALVVCVGAQILGVSPGSAATDDFAGVVHGVRQAEVVVDDATQHSGTSGWSPGMVFAQ